MAKGMWWGPQSRLRKKKLRFKNQYKDQYENPNAPYNVSFGINPILTPKPTSCPSNLPTTSFTKQKNMRNDYVTFARKFKP
jgi:hypothetical protein